MLNLEALQRKYQNCKVMDNNKLIIPINAKDTGLNIYLEEGIWRIKPAYLDALTKDVVDALGLELGTKEANQLKRRVITMPNGVFIFEFMHKDIK